MTTSSIATSVVSFLLFATSAFAQLELPQKSPAASVTQKVGLTEISINYSSPAVHNRQIWGELVPWNAVWRSGANQATKVTFSRDVMVDGHALAAGSYGFLTIPGKETWTVIFNSRSNVGGLDYDADTDVLRFQVAPQQAPFRERLNYSITDFDDSSAKVQLEWEKLRIAFTVTCNTSAHAKAAIDQALNSSWRPYADAARYTLDTAGDLTVALGWIDQSLALREDWLNSWIKAQILAAQGKEKEALNWAEKAKLLGEKSSNFYMKDAVLAGIKKWEKPR